jgi:D-alanyl-D-alanine carboxypeptidase
MTEWLRAALDYVPRWLEYQVEHTQQPGCAVAIAHQGEIVLDQAFGVANLVTGARLTPRHRFRVASHSKTFTAAGILKLKDLGRLRLDDTAGTFVQGLHPDVAAVTVQQLLSHSAGLVRDGADSGQFSDRRPFRSAAELRADLAVAQPIGAAERFKYSNHGFGLLGLIIEAVTGESYTAWIMREIVAAAGLSETAADIGLATGSLSSGHSTRLPLGRRLAIPGDNPTNDVASATGFVSTAADLAKFFAQLSPRSRATLLSPLSRREMTRRHWRDTESSQERYYGLGTISGSLKGWDWFGHSGSFQGTLSRTAVFSAVDITVSVLTNAMDGPAQIWLDGIGHILQAFHSAGAPSSEAAEWAGRWWALWGAIDLVPIGNKVLASAAVLNPPFSETSEITLTGRDSGKVVRASGFSSPGEVVRRLRGANGEVAEIWIGGGRFASEQDFALEITARYEKSPEKA